MPLSVPKCMTRCMTRCMTKYRKRALARNLDRNIICFSAFHRLHEHPNKVTETNFGKSSDCMTTAWQNAWQAELELVFCILSCTLSCILSCILELIAASNKIFDNSIWKCLSCRWSQIPSFLSTDQYSQSYVTLKTHSKIVKSECENLKMTYFNDL